jgi:hypothetical protein
LSNIIEGTHQESGSQNSALLHFNTQLDCSKPDTTQAKRTYNEAIIEACQLEHGTDLEKEQCVHIIKKYSKATTAAKKSMG